MKRGSVHPWGVSGSGSVDDRDVSVFACRSFPWEKMDVCCKKLHDK